MNLCNSKLGRTSSTRKLNQTVNQSIARAIRGTVEALEARQLLSSVAVWHFDEPTGHGTAADASGNSHTATLHGGADFIQARGGQALSLDGSSGWASVAHDSGIDLTGAVTVAGWVKLDGNEQDQKILGTESGSAGGYKLGFYDGKLEFEVRDQNNQYYLDRWTPGGVDLRDGQWHFVAGVYDQAAGYIQTYVDGQLNRELITGGSLVASGHDLVIGRETFDNSNYFHGQIADLAVDDTALSAQQIGDRYTAPTAVHVQALGGTAMRVSWLNGGAATGGYKVEYRAQGASTWTSAGTTASSATALIIDGLTTGTTYEAQVTALYGFNSAGMPSATVPVTTGATDETGYYKVSGVNGETTTAMQTGITAGAATSAGLSVIGNGIVQAADWKEAVYKALAGSVTVSSPASTAGTYAFANNRFEVDTGSVIGAGSIEGSLSGNGRIGANAQAVGFEDYADFDHNDWFFAVNATKINLSLTVTDTTDATNAATNVGDIYVYRNANNQATVNVSGLVTPDTAEMEEIARWKVATAGVGGALPDHGTYATLPTMVTLAPDGGSDFPVQAGLDLNGDGFLNSGEVLRTVIVHIVDKPVVSIAATIPNAAEAGPVNGEFTVSRIGDTHRAITVDYTVDPASTATANADYAALAGSVVIPAGDASAKIPVNVMQDNLVEPAETVIANLSLPSSGEGGTPYDLTPSPSAQAATVTIADNSPLVSVVATDDDSTEPFGNVAADTGTYTFSRTGDTSAALDIYFEVDPMRLPLADKDVDYVLENRGPTALGGNLYRLTFGAGEASIPVTLRPVSDVLVEGDEWAKVKLVIPSIGITPNAGYRIDAGHSAAEIVIHDPPLLDLDVDSDNTNAYSIPDRSVGEDTIEDASDKPGKRLLINDDDTDGDGIPDYADGFGHFGDMPESVRTPGEKFTPLVMELPEGTDVATARIKFSYDASAPSGVGRTGSGTATDPYVFSRASGALRIWKKDGGQTRDERDAAAGGDFIGSGSVYTAAQLGIGADLTVTLWAESVKVSTSLADLRVTASMNPNGSASDGFALKDDVRLTAFGARIMNIDAAGNLSQPDGVEVSHPSPVIDVSNYSVDNLHYDSTNTKVLGDVHIAGSIDDAASDLIPGQPGTVSSLTLALNGADEQFATIDAVVTKSAGTSSVLKPFDFSATFDKTLSDVELQPGWNTFKLTGSNAYGFSGTAEMSAEVNVEPPADDVIDVQLELPDDPYTNSSAALTITARFRKNGGDWTTSLLMRDQPGSMVFHDILGAVIVDLGQGQIFGPDPTAEHTVTVTNDTVRLSGDQLVVKEVPATSGILEGTRVITEDDRVDYRDFALPTLGSKTDPLSSGPGDFHPYVFKFDGPAELVSTLKDAQTDSGNMPIKLGPDQFSYIMYGPDGLKPAVSLFEDVKPGDAGLLPPSQELSVLDSVLSTSEDFAKYMAGTVVGFTKGGVGLVTGTWDLIKAIPHATFATYDYVTSLGVRYVDGDSFEVEKNVTSKTWEAIKVVGEINFKLQTDPGPLFEAIASGSYEPLNNISPEFKVAVETSVELLKNLADEYAEMTPYEAGKVVGRALFEIVSIVLPYTKIGQVSKLAILAKMEQTAAFLDESTALGRAFRKLRGAGKLIEELRTTKMCFVAGTPIQTANGLIPIEQIRAGDMVLSRDEATGDQTYKPVVETIVTHPDALYTVNYDLDGAGPLPPSSVVTTAPHPFYVIGKGFTPAADLRYGDNLALANGTTAQVMDLAIRHADQGAEFTTYNFEVSDYHTYFVNADGIWVHNAGGAICEKALSIYKQFREYGRNAEEAFARANELISKYVTRGTITQDASYKHLGDALDEAVKEARRAAGKYIPEGDIWSPGGVQDSGVNLWERHWLKHKGEFPDFAGPVEYVDRALDFTSHSASSTTLKVVEGDQFGLRQRLIWDSVKNDFAVATIDPATGKVTKLSTYFRLDGAKLRAPKAAGGYGLADIAGGPSVFEQYFEKLGVAKLKNIVRR